MTSGAPALSRRQLLERYTHLREDHLRYMQKWGLIRPSHRAHGETFYAFPDLAVVREADDNLANGATFRAVLRNLLASHRGQLTLDFRIEAQPARVLQLRRPEPPPMADLNLRIFLGLKKKRFGLIKDSERLLQLGRRAPRSPRL